MTIAVLGKAIIIAFMAALTAWLFPVAYLVSTGDSLNLNPASPVRQGSTIALLGSYGVGMPVSLLTYFLARRHLMQSPMTLFTIASLAGVMMILVCLVFGDGFLALMFGVPSLIAALVFATLGWFWILKPEREAANA